MLGLGLYTVLAYPTKLTWWAFLLAVAISYGFSLPIGIIEAVTNNQIGLNVLTEFIFGYIQPGRPLALMLYAPHPTRIPHRPKLTYDGNAVSRPLATLPCIISLDPLKVCVADSS